MEPQKVYFEGSKWFLGTLEGVRWPPLTINNRIIDVEKTPGE